ncbi:MAG: DUF1571 domain-containing protein [Planctomycetaceae bacterium]
MKFERATAIRVIRARSRLACGLLLAVAPAAMLLAKDRPARSDEAATVARKVDERSRLGSEKATERHVLVSAVEAVKSSRETLQRIPGYTTTLIRQERLKKEPVKQVMQLKFRREPFSVYLKFIDPHPGREVLFVEGQNKGKLLVHEASGIVSLAGTISLSPTGDQALKESRYPITMIGMEKMLDALVEQFEGEMTRQESRLTVYPQAKVGAVECKMFEIARDKERPTVRFQKTRLYIDKQSNLPIRIEQYGFPARAGDEGALLEEYVYTDVKTDVTLSDIDFDTRNQTYGFK